MMKTESEIRKELVDWERLIKSRTITSGEQMTALFAIELLECVLYAAIQVKRRGTPPHTKHGCTHYHNHNQDETMRHDNEEGWTVGAAVSVGSFPIFSRYGHGIDRQLIVRHRSRSASPLDDCRNSARWIARKCVFRHCEHSGREGSHLQEQAKKTMRRTKCRTREHIIPD